MQKALETLLAGRTSFIIAHRLSTIQNATRILFIDKGRIQEEETHEELINLRGKYWSLYTSHYTSLDVG